MHKRELLKNKNVDKGELEEAYPNMRSLRDKEGVNHEETFSSRKSLGGESLNMTSSLLSVITPSITAVSSSRRNGLDYRSKS